LRRPDGRLHLVVLDLPESQAVLVRTPRGNRVLIGGAPGGNALASQVGREGGPFGRRLDALIIPSASAAPLEGLPVLLDRIPVSQVYWAVSPPEKRAAERLRESLAERDIPETILKEGAALRLDEGVILRVVTSSKEGAALRLEYGGLRVIWPGGSAEPSLEEMRGSILILREADLKDTPIETWQRVGPQVVIVMGLTPGPLAAGWLSTSSNGRVELISNGGKMTILVKR
jgi:hypothetical protein